MSVKKFVLIEEEGWDIERPSLISDEDTISKLVKKLNTKSYNLGLTNLRKYRMKEILEIDKSEVSEEYEKILKELEQLNKLHYD